MLEKDLCTSECCMGRNSSPFGSPFSYKEKGVRGLSFTINQKCTKELCISTFIKEKCAGESGGVN